MLIYINIFLASTIISFSMIAENCNRPQSANDLAYPVAKTTDAIRLISYNIRGDSKIDREKGNSWDIRKYNIQKLLNYYGPDIIGFQEVSSSYIPDIKQLFKDYTLIAFDTNNIDKDSALLINKKRFNILESNCFWLAQDPQNKYSFAWKSRVTRIVIYVKLIDLTTNNVFFVFCTHFDSGNPIARLESAKILIKQQQLTAYGSPSIILGDFNLFPDMNGEAIYDELTKTSTIKDVRDLSNNNHFGVDGTWIGWPYDPASTPENTIGARLDHIFCAQCKVEKEGVINHKVDTNGIIIDSNNNKYLELSYPSDHLPVITDIILDSSTYLK